MAAQTKHTIELYLKAADEATANAKFNLDGGYPGVAANRAYYAFFYGASALLLSINIIRSKHSAVLSAFRQHFIKPGLLSPDFSDAFGEALDTRQAVDYDMTYGVDEWQAQQLVQTADNFILTVRNYLAKELSDE